MKTLTSRELRALEHPREKKHLPVLGNKTYFCACSTRQNSSPSTRQPHHQPSHPTFLCSQSQSLPIPIQVTREQLGHHPHKPPSATIQSLTSPSNTSEMPKPRNSHYLDMLKSPHMKRNQFLTPSFPNPDFCPSESANILGLKRDFPLFKGFRTHWAHAEVRCSLWSIPGSECGTRCGKIRKNLEIRNLTVPWRGKGCST